ncbi:MAG: TonB-dependent receptor [Candidatus Eremiobacteraeota bacterium]|nr:TonB-dependent receptor [Candidatus Eremiobacteraeota bacterium]
MSSLFRSARARALAFAVIAALCAPTAAFAQTTAPLAGTVTADGAPVVGASVTATGSNLNLHAQTDAHGTFQISAPIGTYEVDVTAPQGHAALRVDLTSAGTSLTFALSKLQEIGRTSVTARPPVRGSGTDLSLSAEALTRSPASGSLPNLLIQLPGAARGANGVVHINGDHGDINYIVDGVQIPQELNRIVGSEFDPNDISFVEALQGAYPARYGERFASVIDITTRNGAGPPGFIGDFIGGSYGSSDGTLGYHTNIGAGSMIAAFRAQRSDRALDPPNFDSPHNQGSNTNAFLRYTLPTGQNFINFTVSRSYQTYQIPNDVAGGEPASSDDNETQEDLFSAIQFRHPIGDHGSLSFGPSYKRSRIRDFGDPSNDFAFGEANAPGNPGDCGAALSSTGPVVGGVVTNPVANPNVNYANSTCAFSLNGDRTAIDVGGNLDYENRSAKHDVAFGGFYDATHVAKTYAVTLQPGNFLAPVFTPGTPGAAYTVVDNAPNVGHLTAVYLQDSWKWGDRWQLDYGARGDSFLVSSAQFNVGFGQVSPRVKLTHFFGARDSVYAYWGRFFTPFSLENVSPLAAYTLNLPLQTNVATFDLKPQRDSVYELGGHFALGSGDLGLRVMQKNATDLIDDTQVGTTNLHQDINYAEGRIATQTAYYQIPLQRAGRFYASVTHTYSVNKGCETQLLAPCFGAPDDFTPADHDQRVDMTSGLILNDRRGGWFGIDGEYGSGLSSGQNPTGGITCGGSDGNVGGPCKRTPHLTFDAAKGIALGNGMALTMRVRNLFNDRYFVTFLNAQGNHYAPPRTFELGLRLNTK